MNQLFYLVHMHPIPFNAGISAGVVFDSEQHQMIWGWFHLAGGEYEGEL